MNSGVREELVISNVRSETGPIEKGRSRFSEGAMPEAVRFPLEPAPSDPTGRFQSDAGDVRRTVSALTKLAGIFPRLHGIRLPASRALGVRDRSLRVYVAYLGVPGNGQGTWNLAPDQWPAARRP
jgi:hypothetical protein